MNGIEGRTHVVNLSRMGIALETEYPLESGQRWSLELDGPAGIERVDFYVVRCEERGSDGATTFLSAGLFVEKLKRKDLPKVVHEPY